MFFSNSVELGAQEAVYIALQIPLTKGTREVVYIRVVKSCQIRHPEVWIRYPDTSERSHRIASYVLVNICIVYARPYCSIYNTLQR